MTNLCLGYDASTPIAPEVLDAMRPFLSGHYDNPPSLHWAGARAKRAVEKARSQVAALLGCSPQEIIFIGGDTEAYNHASKKCFSRYTGKAIIISQLKSNIRLCSIPAASSRCWAQKQPACPPTAQAW